MTDDYGRYLAAIHRGESRRAVALNRAHERRGAEIEHGKRLGLSYVAAGGHFIGGPDWIAWSAQLPDGWCGDAAEADAALERALAAAAPNPQEP